MLIRAGASFVFVFSPGWFGSELKIITFKENVIYVFASLKSFITKCIISIVERKWQPDCRINPYLEYTWFSPYKCHYFISKGLRMADKQFLHNVLYSLVTNHFIRVGVTLLQWWISCPGKKLFTWNFGSSLKSDVRLSCPTVDQHLKKT